MGGDAGYQRRAPPPTIPKSWLPQTISHKIDSVVNVRGAIGRGRGTALVPQQRRDVAGFGEAFDFVGEVDRSAGEFHLSHQSVDQINLEHRL